METFSAIFLSRIVPSVLAIAFVGMTVVTSGVAGVKLLNSEKNDNSRSEVVAIPTLATVEEESASTGATGLSSVSINEQTQVRTKITNSATGLNIFPTAVPLNTGVVTTPPGVSNSNACIVTLFGAQYDVTRLRSTHSGGDIFKCGTDMTSVYQGKHGTSLSRMQGYAVSATGATAGSTSQSTSSVTGSTKVTSHDEDDDNENEDNYVKEHKSSNDDNDD